MSVSDAFRKSLADSFFKKLCPLGDTSIADMNALKKFEDINDSIPDGTFDFSADGEAESCFFDYFKSNFNRCLGFDIGDKNFDLDFIRDHMDIGPGAAQKADPTTIVSKLFLGEMSYSTSEFLLTLYRSALVETGFWADAEMHRFRKFGFSKVDGGKLFFAKKNAEISRTCCTEALLNMLFQKALGAFCEYRLFKHFGIDLSVQPKFNRKLAFIGSIDGSFGTMDLVSASDSNSFSLFNAVMEEGFTKAIFQLSRSEFAVLPNGKKVKMKMISTMGNGFTFPYQTIVFASAVKAVYQLMGFPCFDPSTQFAVFGDDIIVRREAYGFLSRMLTKLGFEVNEGKSFNTGPFRESCGEDYFKGINIRGVYIRSLETAQQVCSCINRLNRWSARSGIPLPRTVSYLLQLVPKAPFVPPSESDEAGIQVPFSATVPKVDNSYWFRYRYYKRRQRKVQLPEPDDCWNPSGSAIGFLSGHTKRVDSLISDMPSLSALPPWPFLGPRSNEDIIVVPREPPDAIARFKISKKSIPYWDWIDRSDVWKDVSHRAWKGVVLVSLQKS